MSMQDNNQHFSVELNSSELGLPDGTSFSEHEYSEAFSESSFSTPPVSTDPDGDGFGIGVDPNEYQTLQHELQDRNTEDMQELFESYVEDHAAERLVENALCEELADQASGPVGSEVVGDACSNFVVDDADQAAAESFSDAYACHIAEDAILSANSQAEKEQAVQEFDADDCGAKIAPLHECLDVAASY